MISLKIGENLNITFNENSNFSIYLIQNTIESILKIIRRGKIGLKNYYLFILK